MDTIVFALALYTVYCIRVQVFEGMKVLHQTIYEKHLSLNCLADHLEKDFILSKQLVTVGLLVPAHIASFLTHVSAIDVLCT
jgi:hypothetical protein